jgi:hypothetical protein
MKKTFETIILPVVGIILVFGIYFVSQILSQGIELY